MVDTKDRGVPDVEVKVVEVDSPPADDGPGYHTATYRTGADGRVRITVDARYKRLTFEARPDDQTLGWASLRSDHASPKATDEDPIKLILLSRNHEVEGTIVDIRGKPIRGAQVRAVQFNHAANGFATDYPRGDEDPSLASAVTDETGRYRLSLPEGTTTILRAYHPSHVGESFSWKSEGQTIAPAIMEDAGGITGTVVDSATGSPVPAANIDAQRIERTERILGGNGGNTVSNAQGHFRVGGLAPGVYNLLLRTSPRGRRFTARAVEGVRVKAGEEARADLRMIEGRRLHGTVASARTGKPLTGVPIFCYSALTCARARPARGLIPMNEPASSTSSHPARPSCTSRSPASSAASTAGSSTSRRTATPSPSSSSKGTIRIAMSRRIWIRRSNARCGSG